MTEKPNKELIEWIIKYIENNKEWTREEILQRLKKLHENLND